MSASDEVINGWRECADPVELAAAVAAGVEVQVGDFERSVCTTAEDFADCMSGGSTYRPPSSWSWSPEPPAPVTGDDLRERIVKVIDDWHSTVEMWSELDDLADAVLAVLPAPPDVAMHDGEPVEQWRYDALVAERDWLAARLEEADAERTTLRHKLVESMSPVPPWPGDDDWCEAVLNDLNSIIHQHCGSDGSDDAHCDWVNDLACEVVRYFQRHDVAFPSPVPPWPGAVLSGLTDEDGVPTWLAQAGQVRGEQVRGVRGGHWRPNTLHYGLEWVEVRAPRAVPEPETELVPWWEAVGREVFDQDGERVTIEHVQCGDGAGPSVTAYNAAERRDTSLLRVPITVRGDGTVEVLKDGGR